MKDLVLVTGASGYLGERVVTHLGGRGISVRAAIGTRKPHWLEGASEQSWCTLRLENEAQCAAAVAGVSSIVHLAALNEWDCAKDPVRALEINSIGTLKLVQAAVQSGVRRIVYISTAHVYGDLKGVINEDIVPKPTHPYAYSHHVSEDVIRSFAVGSKIEGVSLRLSNGFGAPVSPSVNRWTLLVNDLCRQAVTQKQMKLTSRGEQLRDFIPMTDVCRATEHALALPSESCRGHVYNLGGNFVISVWRMAQLIQERCAATLGFTPTLERPDLTTEAAAKVQDFSYDSTLLAQTGFRLSGTAADEIDQLLRFCSEHFS